MYLITDVTGSRIGSIPVGFKINHYHIELGTLELSVVCLVLQIYCMCLVYCAYPSLLKCLSMWKNTI